MFHFKANRKSIGFLNNNTRDFQNSPPFERLAYFYVAITGNFERFEDFRFEANFLGSENLFHKTRVLFFS